MIILLRRVLLLLLLASAPVAPLSSSNLYDVQACVVDKDAVLESDGTVLIPKGKEECALTSVTLWHMKSPVTTKCDATWDQQGSVSWGDMTLPEGKMLVVKATTKVDGQTMNRGFFVRPSRLTSAWERPAFVNTKTAIFPIRSTGQFSVEFTPPSTWRDKSKALNFPALMLFVNPTFAIPAQKAPIVIEEDAVKADVYDLGPENTYIFTKANSPYDWGQQQVFKVHDNTTVYFEEGAHVRARIIQTDKKVKNVEISGYGILDNHYEPEEYDIQGVSDDGSMQTITIYGKNIRVFGVTLINTNPACHAFGYCLNINANWSPLADANNPFEAGELQGKNPPYKYHRAHCQELNMDDTPNKDFTNCPTSREVENGGNVIASVKCLSQQMGQDGINGGKYGTVENSFVRVIDDAIKPWDSGGLYKNIVIWQLALGWPINFGWWNWGSKSDAGTLIEDIYLIHNHNWVSSADWPETESGQCVVGGVYGSGVVKTNYTIRNVFVETAASCAIGLEISNQAYSKHLTTQGCVANIQNTVIEGMYFDEEFFEYNGGYTNFISGEMNPAAQCAGNLSGRVESISIAADVAGRPLSLSDFKVQDETVSGLTFSPVSADPHPLTQYTKFSNKRLPPGGEIDKNGVVVPSAEQCIKRCESDWSCGCVVFTKTDSKCRKRRNCVPTTFIDDETKDVFVRPSPAATTAFPTASPTESSSSNPSYVPTSHPTSNQPTRDETTPEPSILPSFLPPTQRNISARAAASPCFLLASIVLFLYTQIY